MSEWQPALIINAHPEIPCTPTTRSIQGKRVRIREITFSEPHHLKWLREDCDTKRAFEVHPQDWQEITGELGKYVACEHEILTD
jgi:hypothetical protein